MPAAGTQATGSGALRFVIVIEGVPYAFVSDATDATNAASPYGVDAFSFYPGLMTHDWEFSESVDLVAAQVDVKSVQLRIVDVGGWATQCFDSNPSITTWLVSDFSDTELTSITVRDTTRYTDLPRGMHFGLETIQVDVIDGTHFEPQVRGKWRSYATYHYAGTGSAADISMSPITDRPTFFEGRRVEFFAYDENEPISINATDRSLGDLPFWIGIITGEPTYDGATWSLQVDHISSRLKQKIGADLSSPRSIRGIYYPAQNPWAIEIWENTTTAQTVSLASLTRVAWCGFAETQDAWCTSVNALIATAIANPVSGSAFLAGTKIVVEPSSSSWRLRVDTPSADARYIQVRGLGPGGACSLVDKIATRNLKTEAGNFVDTVANQTSYYVELLDQPGVEAPGTVPRTFLFGSGYTIGTTDTNANRVIYDVDAYPPNRLYIDGDVDFPSSSTSAQIQWQSTGGAQRQTGDAATYRILTVDTTNRFIEVDATGTTGAFAITSQNLPKITFSIWLGSGSLADLFDSIVSLATQYAPLGTIPMLQSDEIDTGDIRAAASSNILAGRRSWTVVSAKDLGDIVAQECRLLGVFPTTSSTGALTFKRLRFATGGEASAGTLTESDFLGENGEFFTLQRQPYGVINTWTLCTGYNAQSDKNEGPTITVVDVESRSNAGRSREIRITPFSEDPPGQTTDVLYDMSQRLAANVLGVLGGPYRMLTCRVPLTKWALRGGDVVAVTWPRLPNGAGTLGTTAQQGIIVGRTMHPRGAYIELVMLVTGLRVAGYSPSAKVSIDSGTSGTKGPFAVSMAAGYLPNDGTPATFWAVGDKIRAIRFDDTTPDEHTGTVTAVSSTQLTFTTDANWTHAGHSWIVGSQISTSVTSSQQKLYSYDATSAAIAAFSDENLSAYVFS